MLKTREEQHSLFGKEKLSGWRLKTYIIIFEAETPAGKVFDVALMWVIIASVLAVMLESMTSVRENFGDVLYVVEWIFTVLFTIEYVTRLVCSGNPLRYARSFYGVIDLLAVIPTYLSVLVPGAQFLLVVRLLRILRVFRVLKLARLLSEANILVQALQASRHKIFIFLYTVLTLVVILGSLMYVIEGSENGFTSIPRSIYWAIVTLTTVGYGDISPHTDLGQALAAIVMIMGYGIIAVPTGIVTAELSKAGQQASETEAGTRALICPKCYAAGHDDDASYCKRCGTHL